MDDFFKFVVHFLKDRFETFSKIKGCEIIDLNSGYVPEDFFQANHRSEIFVYGQDLTTKIQIFFRPEAIQQKNEEFGSKNKLDTIDEVYDFYNEVCNLSGGKVKLDLSEADFTVALSLPVSVETTELKALLEKEVLPETVDGSIDHGGQSLFYFRISAACSDMNKLQKGKFSTEEEDNDIEFF